MDKYFVSRRAGLGRFLEKRRDSFDASVMQTEDLTSVVLKTAGLNSKQTTQFLESMLVSLCSQIDSLIVDTAIEIGNCFPRLVLKKESSFATLEVIENMLISKLVEDKIESFFYSLGYKKFSESIAVINTCFGISSFDPTQVTEIADLRAARDILVHNNGIINETYLRKAINPLGRAGDRFNITEKFISTAVASTKSFADEYEKKVLSKYYKFKRVQAFRDMWENSKLQASSGVKFDEVWEIDSAKEDMVRPIKTFSWAWSGSEQLMFDFLGSIYSGSGQVDYRRLLERWSIDDGGGEIVISWLMHPFSF